MCGSCQPLMGADRTPGRKSQRFENLCGSNLPTRCQLGEQRQGCPLIKIGELHVLARFGRHLERAVMLLDDDVMAKRKPKPRAFPRRRRLTRS